jgi:hypothetical protein
MLSLAVCRTELRSGSARCKAGSLSGNPSATRQLPSLEFEADSVKRSLEEMDGAVVCVDDELAIGPLGVLVSADQKFQGKLFEHVIVGGLEFAIGQRSEDGARFADIGDE